MATNDTHTIFNFCFSLEINLQHVNNANGKFHSKEIIWILTRCTMLSPFRLQSMKFYGIFWFYSKNHSTPFIRKMKMNSETLFSTFILQIRKHFLGNKRNFNRWIRIHLRNVLKAMLNGIKWMILWLWKPICS